MTTGRQQDISASVTPTSRGGAVLIGALVIDSIGSGLFLPLSLIYFTKVTDVPLATIGLVMSVANIMQLPIPLWAGALADRLGGVPLVVGAQFLQAVSFLITGWATGPLGIFAAVTIGSVGVRIFWSTIFTVLADYVDTSPGGRSKDHWYAWANISRTAGMGIGGVLTGFAISDVHTSAETYRFIAYCAALCFTVAAVTITVFLRVPHLRRREVVEQGGYRSLLRDRPFLGLIGVNTCYALSYMMLSLALPTAVLTALHAPSWLSSGLLTGNTVLVSLVTAPIIARLRIYRRTRILITAAALWCGWSLAMAALRPGSLHVIVPVVVIATLMYSLATIMHSPVSMALAAAAAPEATRGRYLASFQYSFTFAEMIGPVFFTTLFAAGHSLPWLALAVLNVMSITGMLALERKLPKASLREGKAAVAENAS
jgi:MFS family permease